MAIKMGVLPNHIVRQSIKLFFVTVILLANSTMAQVSQDEWMDATTRNLLQKMPNNETRHGVAKIVINTVQKKGVKLVGVGSWISGKGYVDPIGNGTSDHDLRLVLQNVGESEATRVWNEVRDELIKEVKANFKPNEVDQVLKSINLYPPEVVLEGIDDAAEALQKLEKLGMNPNLGGAITEGLWGKGAKAFRDAYEKTSGRVFWQESGKVFSGFADLLPLGETSGLYTIEGSARIASQFVDKTKEALEKSDAKTVRKNLHRLSESLKKSRDLARIQKANYFDEIIQKLDNYGDDFEALKSELANPSTRQTIDRLLGRAKLDAELLKNFATTTHPRNFTILKEMLEAESSRWSRVKNTFLEVNAHIPWTPLVKGFLTYMQYLQVKSIAEDLGAGEQEKVFAGLLTEAGFVVSAPAGVLSLLVSSILQDAKDAGYLMVIQSQDCEDLIAGLYEVKGREDATQNQKIETNIDQLAKEFTEEAQIIPIIALHARNAASRGIDGKETQKVDAEVEKKLNEKCLPIIVEKWRNKRADLIEEAAKLFARLDEHISMANLIGVINPSNIVLQNGQASTTASAKLDLNTLNATNEIQSYLNAILLLGGKQKVVAVTVTHHYRWLQGGKEIAFNEENFLPSKPIFNQNLASHVLNFKTLGHDSARFEYQLKVDITTIASDVLASNNKLSKTFDKKVDFWVEVSDKEDVGSNSLPAPTDPTTTTSKTSEAKLNVPKEVLATELVDAEWVVPAALKGKILKYNWSNTCPPNTTGPLAKIQFRNPLTGKPQLNTMYVVGLDASNIAVTSASENITVKPVFFKGAASDVWEGGSSSYGLVLTRKPAVRQRDALKSATVSGQIDIKWADSFAPKSLEEIQKELSRRKGDNLSKVINPITIAGFKGYILENKEVSQGFNGSGYVDAGYPDAGAGGFGYAIKGCLAIEFSYSAGGSGTLLGEGAGFGKPERAWWNDIPFLLSQTKAAITEAKSILTSISLAPDGTITKTPYKGPKLDGSDLASVRLVVSPNLKKLKKGDVVNVQAVIDNEQNADKSIEYTWLGDHAGNGNSVKFLATKPGKQSLAVMVKGIGSASVEFEVADVKAEIVQVSPSSSKIAIGTPVSFVAKLLSNGLPINGNYIYRWQPTPEERFEPIESESNQTKAVFSRPGITKVWVQILEKKGSVLETIAESEQLEIEVTKPELAIVFSSPNVMVGNELKAQVKTVPANLPDADFWWEISSNARQTAESKNRQEVSFIPLDNKPVTVTVHARVLFKGDDLGSRTDRITPQLYQVKVNVLGAEGPKPMVWKQGIGFVPLENSLAIHQFVGLSAEISPTAENLRYEWTLNEDSHFESNNISRQIRVSRSQVGTCIATVVVRNANGIELGRASGTFDVSVSQEELDKGAKSASKLAKAKELIKKDQLDEAIDTIDEYLTLNTNDTEALTLSKTWKANKATILVQLEKVRVLTQQSKFDEAEQQLLIAQHLHILYKPVLDADAALKTKRSQNDAKVTELLGEARLANESKQFNKTITIAAFLRKNYTLSSAAEAEITRYEEWAKPLEQEKERRRELIKQAEVKLTEGEFDGVLKIIEEVWKNFDVYWSYANDTEPTKASKIQEEALRRREFINSSLPFVKQVIESQVFDKAKVSEAINKAEEILKLQAKNLEVQNYKRILTERLAKNEKSAADISKSDAFIKAGDQQHNQKKYQEAVESFTQAIALNSNAFDAWRLRGRSKRELKDYQGAIADYTQAIVLNPKSSSAYNGRGWAKELSGDFEGALNDLNQAVLLDPNNELAVFNRAFHRNDQKDYAGAIADYDRVVALNPTNVNAFLNRGLAKEQVNNITAAINDFERVLVLEPANQNARQNITRLKNKLATQQADSSKPNSDEPTNKASANGTTSWGTSYPAGTKGDVFNGGTWTSSQGSSDWLQLDFNGAYLITDINIASAGTDVTTKGSRLVLKLQNENNEWISIDDLRETNINLEKLSYGNTGTSIPIYNRSLTKPIAAKAFRLEFYGNGWFSARDIKIVGSRVGNITPNVPTKTAMGWTLIKTVDYNTPPTDKNYTLSYSNGVIGWRWTLNNDVFAFNSSWTEPPRTIRSGDRITFTITVSVTENEGNQYSANGDFSIWFDHPNIEPGIVISPIGFTNEKGESGGINVSHRNHGTPSITRTIWVDASQLPSGNIAGTQIALMVMAANGRLAGKKYIYEWR